jgi:geranylgeranyl diphosphate synthase type II
MKTELSTFFDRVIPAVDDSLNRLLPAENTPPANIHKAMRYSVFAGGKRLRPALCIGAYALYQPDWKPILPVASALEMIHTYSLIHDDLPAMDNDDYRRGIPSCHKQFGEATAILAGDGLLTFAFESLARCTNFPPDRVVSAMSMLGRAAGTQDGMIAGQLLDLEAEGRSINQTDLEAIHRSKTAALICASVAIGAYLGGAPEDILASLRQYGSLLGLAFQVVDDILDETASIDTLGKTGGKDRTQQKATYPAMYGLEKSRAIARELTQAARKAVAPLGSRVGVLIGIADYLETRSH